MSDLATWSVVGVIVVGWSVTFAVLQRGRATGQGEGKYISRFGDGHIAVKTDTLLLPD